MSPDTIETCKAALRRANIDIEDAPGPVQRKSRDFYWYSPILKRQLADVTGDFIASPKNEAEVREILAICYEHDVPVTPRGAGTGNYGQAMPLRGGCVLSTHAMTKFEILDDRLISEPGAVLYDLEVACREKDQELRLFPSTVKTASIGGFVAGGSSGVGAIRWGGLRNPANIHRLRLLTMEAEPRVVEFSGAEAHKAAHAYGVNGIITELEMPTAPATDWLGVIIGLPELSKALECGRALGQSDATLCRMISVFETGIAENYFLRHRDYLTDGEALLAVYIAPDDLPALRDIAAQFAGQVRYMDGQADRRMPPLFELGWNHTTLRAMKVDPDLTYLQMMCGSDAVADAKAMKDRFGDEIQLHFELTTIMGEVRAAGMPLVRFTTEERLEDIVTIMEDELGLAVFNPHRVTLEEGGMKQVDDVQLAFKKEADPKGLLNPGKMIAWEDPNWSPEPGRNYLFEATRSGETQ